MRLKDRTEARVFKRGQRNDLETILGIWNIDARIHSQIVETLRELRSPGTRTNFLGGRLLRAHLSFLGPDSAGVWIPQTSTSTSRVKYKMV
jgi:hypothetical protein